MEEKEEEDVEEEEEEEEEDCSTVSGTVMSSLAASHDLQHVSVHVKLASNYHSSCQCRLDDDFVDLHRLSF